MQQALGTRLAKFGLALCADKTRLIEFDRSRTEVLRARRYGRMRQGNRSRMYRPRFRAWLFRFTIVTARIVQVRCYP